MNILQKFIELQSEHIQKLQSDEDYRDSYKMSDSGLDGQKSMLAFAKSLKKVPYFIEDITHLAQFIAINHRKGA